MRHCPPEQLALAALREPLPAEDATHLAACARCRGEVAALHRAVETVAVPELSAAGPGAVPPPSVWSGIAAATGVRSTPRPDRIAGALAAAPLPAATPPDPAASRRRWRGRRPPARLLLATAAAAVGAGIALGAVALGHTRGAGTAVAETHLQALGGTRTAGTAVVVEHADHSRELDVTLRGAPPGSGYYEVWLADPGLHRMVAVGVLHDGRATLELPTRLDIRSYPVVDVSDEPLDGDPRHSTRSVARGELR